MPKVLTTIFYSIAITLLIFLSTTSHAVVHTNDQIVHIDLALSFAIDQKLLRGTMKVIIPPDREIGFNLDGLSVTGALLDYPGHENQLIKLTGDTYIQLKATSHEKTLTISYERIVANDFRDRISADSIVLTSLWHPIPDRKTTFTLNARVPPGFVAVSESDHFSRTSPDGLATFTFSQPIFNLTFAAAPYVVSSRQVRDGLTVYTLFFREDQHLSAGYLDSATQYLSRYESRIAPFPYNHYLIVENYNPTGFGLPTFTLLGRQVLRLPFIRNTSLGHEILHSWFGNNITISADSGNWCEGLTTYLADMSYRQEQGDGAQSRREKIQEYFSYVKPATIPLNDFRYAHHDRSANRATRAIGYGSSAFLFHELKQRLGDEYFTEAIKTFYQNNQGQAASWDDIQSAFEITSGTSLSRFFSERLNRTEITDLQITSPSVQQGQHGNSLSFSVQQLSSHPFEITLPFTVKTSQEDQQFSMLLTDEITEISIDIDGLPLELVIDPDYDILRTLSDREYTPTWSQFMGSDQTTLILTDEQSRSVYQPIIDMAPRYSWKFKGPDDLDTIDTTAGYLLFLGTGSSLSKGMYGKPSHPDTGFTLDVRAHSSLPGQPVGLISSSSRDETDRIVSRLSHYGKYSYLHFKNGRISDKFSKPAQRGIHFPLLDMPSGTAVSQISDFDSMVTELSTRRVIYVGEFHTSRADHLLQFMLIEALHKKNPDLAIGMEMFPRSSQSALDEYINSDTMTEADFLKNSNYYNVWGYDYRLFRPIFSYAKRHRINVVGLNIDRNIVSSVFKSNGLGELTTEERQQLPAERVLDLEGYGERLRKTFAYHGSEKPDNRSFHGFIQAQSIWDETMAETVSDYLENHPGTTMIVLAGSQHTRKDSGIPPRVHRRLPVSQASVVNLATTPISGQELSATADYLFFLDTPNFPAQGKIGIVLQKIEDENSEGMKILEVNPASDAAQAGLLKNDILTSINTMEINDMIDVRSAMLDKSVGEIITIVVKRTDDINKRSDHTYRVKLFNPDMARKHP